MAFPHLVTRALTAAFVILMMLGMGLELGGEVKADKAAKRHKRIFLVIGLLFNVVVLPMMALTLVRAFGVGDEVAIALLLLASTPGGRFAPQIGKIAHANLGLSVEITLFLAKLVAFTAPETARLLLHTQHLELHELPIILQLLVLQMLPYFVGRFLRKRRPELAARMRRPIAFAMWACVAALAVIVIVRLRGLGPIVDARGWWAAILFALIAPTMGWAVGGRDRGTRAAIAVSANARDVALATLLASLAFVDDSGIQIATLAVWAVLLVINIVFARLVAGHPRRRDVAQPLPSGTAQGGTP